MQDSKNRYGSQQENCPAIGVNAIKVVKKKKDKAKDLSHIKYYTYKQKNYYVNKCLEKSKN